MTIHEYYPEAGVNVLLIHPMLASAEMMKTYLTDHWDGKFRCLIPDLSGNGVDRESVYISAGEEAKYIHDWLLQHGISKIRLAYAASMGGGVLFELLSYKDIAFENIYFEGASFFKNSPGAEAVVKKLFCLLRKRAIKHPESTAGLIGKVYDRESGRLMTGLLGNMSDESIANIMYDFCHAGLPEISGELQRRCTFAYGSKDSDRKACLKIQPVKYPYARVEIWNGYGHCGRPILDGENYAKMLECIAEYHFWGWEHADAVAVTDEYKGIETPIDLYDALSHIWCAETCAPRMRDQWTKDNMTLGQCSITAFLAQDIFGGKVYGILRPGGNYHCFNVIGNCRFDLTSEQFDRHKGSDISADPSFGSSKDDKTAPDGGRELDYEDTSEQFREIHFAKEEKRLRYEYLRSELKKYCEAETM